MKRDSEAEPLTPAVLHILMALSDEQRHGYAIMQLVERQSGGRFKMGPGTLYGSLKRMMEAGLVRESEEQGDPRRRFYGLTDQGREALTVELARLEQVLASARALKLVGGQA